MINITRKRRSWERERESESEANRQTKKKKKTNLFFVKQRTFVEHIDPNHSKMSIDHQDHYYRQHHSWLMKDPFLCLMNLHCHLAHTYLHKDDAKNFEKIKDMRWEKKEFWRTFFASFSITSYGSVYRSQCKSGWLGINPPRLTFKFELPPPPVA